MGSRDKTTLCSDRKIEVPKAIINAKIILEDKIAEDLVVIYDENISQIIIKEELVSYDNIETIDIDGAYLSAGFIDIHIHGSGGADTMDATFDALHTISNTILSTGTTSFLATTMTMSKDKIVGALENISSNKNRVTGAKIIGVHMEGPYINPAMCGAQDINYIQSPSLEIIDEYNDIIKMITLSPEVEGGYAFIKEIKEKYPHIILSIGHSNANYEEATKSFDAGISHATHLGNAMSGLHHRNPGVLGATLNSNITCDVIADLIHTHKATLELFWKIKKEKLILITDSMRAGCMKCGEYSLGGQKVIVENGKAVLENGKLAGSVLKLNEALKNMTKNTDMDLIDAVK
ncbi:MAG: N-acetylglucosamine-6-phosphate deacetylase, partial [Campylobacterales bacterium]|nr:N-acetylglucosamine-6-phosphate deacetylase [Campylobacterales bacterium]